MKISRNKRKANNKGITLIALVITVIILLILAAVSIATLTGENGILTRANDAKENTEKAEEDELKKLIQAEAATYFEDYEYTDSNGEKVKIPEKCAVSQVEGEKTVEDGLVIIDINGNEWVWIEVPKSIMPEGLTFTNETDYATLETALQTYAGDYRKTEYADEWYDGCGLQEGEYTQLKQSMLKSVYENGGFYIGKYETGSFDNPVTSNDITRKAVIQKGAYPYNYVTCSQAQAISEGLSVGNKTSSLMFGIQWDLVLKYLEVNGDWDTSTHDASYYLKTDSSSWGNYRNAEFSVKEGNKYATYNGSVLGDWNNVPRNYTKPSYNSWLTGDILTTGATKRNSKMNIYDLAGNEWEWSLEKGEDISVPCITRAGNYFNFGYGFMASSYYAFTIDNNYNDVGFRVSLY